MATIGYLCKFSEGPKGLCTKKVEKGTDYCSIHLTKPCKVCGVQAERICHTVEKSCGIYLCNKCICPCIKE